MVIGICSVYVGWNEKSEKRLACCVVRRASWCSKEAKKAVAKFSPSHLSISPSLSKKITLILLLFFASLSYHAKAAN